MAERAMGGTNEDNMTMERAIHPYTNIVGSITQAVGGRAPSLVSNPFIKRPGIIPSSVIHTPYPLGPRSRNDHAPMRNVFM